VLELSSRKKESPLQVEWKKADAMDARIAQKYTGTDEEGVS